MTRRTWQMVAGGMLAGTLAVGVLAACPPTESDGAQVRKDALQLAWSAQLKGRPTPASSIPMAQHFTIEVQLCEGAMPSSAPLSKVDATMPEHRHGMNYRPRITPLGNGRYRAEGMMFHMSGRWRLEFEVQTPGGSLRLFDDVRIR